jgi:16S rRNA processing protein RimM
MERARRGAGGELAAGRVVIGRISGLHGVHGWVKLFSHTAPRENLLAYEDVELGREDPAGGRRWSPATLREGRRQGKTLVARIDGIEDRDAAAAWVGAEIAVARAALPPAAAGEYYWVDLIGLAVENTDGESFGTVGTLIETGAHDVLVVQGERERLIPFAVGPIVKDVDLEQGRILVDWDADY